VNCWLVPFAIDAVAGLIEREVNTAGETVNPAEPLIEPDVAVTVEVP
jgi:hypothetical protein